MKILFNLLGIFAHFAVTAQQLTLIENYQAPGNVQAWTIDGQQNLLVATENTMFKKSIFTERKFTQTFKGLGSIQSIQPVNAMKILLFSEVQQSISVVDNTLSQQGDLIDLNELEFSNVHAICSSNRPNLIWIFDQFRSSLQLFDFNQMKAVQIIQNVEKKGISFISMKEYQDHLYVLFSDGSMNRYDFLLNYTGSYQLDKCHQFDFWKDQLIWLGENTSVLHFTPIHERSSERSADWQLESPMSSFHLQGEILGIQNGTTISLFSIKY